MELIDLNICGYPLLSYYRYPTLQCRTPILKRTVSKYKQPVSTLLVLLLSSLSSGVHFPTDFEQCIVELTLL